MNLSRTALAAAVALTLASAAVARDNRYVDATTIRQVQQVLTQRGFRPGPVDGVMGPATQAAIRSFQKSENLEALGQLNRQTLAALGLQVEPPANGVEPRLVYSATTVREVQQTLNNRGYRAGPFDGVMHPATQAAVKEFQKSENLEATGELNRQTLAALGVTPEVAVAVPPRVASVHRSATIREVQQALNARGFHTGAVDGVMGPATRTALGNFQKSQNLEATGALNARTLAALDIQPAPVIGVLSAVPPGSTTVRQVQHALNQRGYRAGPVDGLMGQATQTALMQFQRAENLEATGALNQQTLAALGIRAG
jgi:peptidoglycan hydrolase-like protein with peptidoglycan-binding domain